jgi:hypothetical protein
MRHAGEDLEGITDPTEIRWFVFHSLSSPNTTGGTERFPRGATDKKKQSQEWCIHEISHKRFPAFVLSSPKEVAHDGPTLKLTPCCLNFVLN